MPSADDWDDLLVPEIDRQQAAGRRVAFRADAAFARPAIYEGLERRDVAYAIRMPANKNLELAVEDILFRRPGRPSCKPLVRYKSFRYQAKSWTTPRRIVAKVEHHRGELFPRVGFIVTNMTLPSRSVVRFYNKRGTAEQWINYIRDFSPYREVFSRWRFTGVDFDTVPLEPTDFIYADPPYDVEFTQYAKEGFTWDDQVRTPKWLTRHKGPVALSNQATQRIVALYRQLGFTVQFLSAPRMISCNGDRTRAREVLATRNI